MAAPRSSALASALVCIGCAEADPPLPPEERALVDPENWEVAATDDDVFAHLRPPDVVCDDELGYGFDMLGGQPSFEINTGRCNYLTVTQPALVAIAQGDPLSLSLWHFELTSMEPDAAAFVTVAIDGEAVWETTIPIPGPSELVIAEWDAPADAPAGAPLQFHLNNHGINSWDLLSINVTN